MAANGISTLETKEERQIAKLELAQAKRQLVGTQGYRDLKYYDIDLLPTKYVGNDVVNNPNVGGLVAGRPWKTTPNTVLGLWRTVYNNFWQGDVTFFDNSSPVADDAVTDFSIADFNGEYQSYQWLGYFRAPHTANYIFYMYSDDDSAFWIGDNAITAYTLGNSTLFTDAPSGEVSTDPIPLTAGDYYPIRIQYGNNAGAGYFSFSWSDDHVEPFPTFEQVDTNGATISTSQTAAFKLTVQSSTYQVNPHVNGQISINDYLITDTSSRGHTVLAMQSDGTVIEQNSFDTWGDTANALAAMNTALLSYPSGTVIAICTYDACSLSNEVRVTLNTYYGGTLTTEWEPTRFSHIFIGQKV